MIFKPTANKPLTGFSLIELLFVIAIIAIMVLAVLPALNRLVPRFELRSASSTTSTLLREARLQASNFQKPARAVIDCRKHTAPDYKEPCMTSIYSAKFNSAGKLEGWHELLETRRILPSSVTVRANTSPSVIVAKGNPTTGLYWIVFLPSGKAITSHTPMQLSFASTRHKLDNWQVGVNNGTGRVTLQRSGS